MVGEREQDTAVLTPDDVRRTYDVLSPHIRRTPVLDVDPLDLTGEATPGGWRLTVKLEHLQRSGSFKVRGAFANLLLRALPEAGVVAASGGNHGVAVAFAAHRLGVRARIYVPTISAPAKMQRIRELGAELVVGGDRFADALAAAETWIAESGALSVHAFDQRETLLGQGGVAVELAEQVPRLDTVLVPVGGGGLIGGIAAYLAGSVRVVGVEPTGAPTLHTARAHGAPADAPADSVAADALAPRRIGHLAFRVAQSFVDDVVLVEDADILAAQQAMWQAARIVVEPAAAVGVAALQSGAYRPAAGERVAVVLSGANRAPDSLA